ncbi:DUF4350 domain-containing protein [Wenyingzhuangia marina]|uniref:DUF4350 domain-containing protein n=1 Tax=Wenyingzhuangia marina TaxID=1195760 RepID=A0A1M5SCT5_9FLAO|nr:DUF4350 domain-containing protein [Wenyingzhuangia marina]GGF61756.1 hypothetical protein GCM10011397_01040 [Wenyingzhuangia marina]SHH36344.1 hypothetical protein SAMN05444281_0244 [Wenyingzhuangia marina]
MKKKGFIILGIVIVVVIAIIDSITPKKVVWTPTYNEKETSPFDLKIFHDQLNDIFKEEKITTIKNTFYEYYQEKPFMGLTANSTYINIDEQYQPDPSSEENLLEFIGKGNIAFISANNFSTSLLDSLKLNNTIKNQSLLNVDRLKLSLKNSADVLNYKTKFKFQQFYFKDSTNYKALGMVSFKENDSITIRKNNFIEVKYKRGLFYLHTQPEIFTNYYLLKANNTKYINQLLSSIPSKISSDLDVYKTKDFVPVQPIKSTVYFESNFKSDDALTNSPLRFIKSQKELYAAWILLIIAIGIFLLINAKRKQRIIPIIPKVRNTSIDFVETIAILYEEADNFQPIIHHKINIFYKNIRNAYNIVTDNTNPKLVAQLSLKSGYDLKKTKELIRFVNALKVRETSSITLLKKLNKEIEDFNKNTNTWKN